MNEIPKQQTEGEELEPRKTGNIQLDRLLNEAALMPLAISNEEILHLVPKSGSLGMNNLRNFKFIIGGIIVLTGLVLYMISPSHKVIPVKNEIHSTSNDVVESEDEIEVATEAEETNISSNNANKPLTTLSETSVKANKQTAVNSNKNSIYLEGTKTVILTHEGRAVSVELNQSGVKKIIDNGSLVSVDKYTDYNEDIEQAYKRVGLKFQPDLKNNSSKKEALAEAIIQGLYQEKLLSEGQSYDLILSRDNAILNGKKLSDENRHKMLEIVQVTTGKILPEEGKIHIRH